MPTTNHLSQASTFESFSEYIAAAALNLYRHYHFDREHYSQQPFFHEKSDVEFQMACIAYELGKLTQGKCREGVIWQTIQKALMAWLPEIKYLFDESALVLIVDDIATHALLSHIPEEALSHMALSRHENTARSLVHALRPL